MGGGGEAKSIGAVLIIQLIYAGMFLLSKVAFDVGINPLVFVFYRQAVAAVFLAPIALFFEWKAAPPFSFAIFIKIFLLSLCGITASLDIFGIALKSTSSSLGAAIANTLPAITFFLAVLFRREEVKLRTRPGIMKVGGVVLCIGGAGFMAFYRGAYLRLLVHNHLINLHASQQLQGHVVAPKTWIKGVFLMLLSNITWGLWLVLQGRVLKSYPSKLLCTTIQCFMSATQSFILAFAFARNPAEWRLGWNVRLLSVAYCGIVVTGVTFYLQAWVIEKKGPVFLAMTTPLALVFTIIISTFLLGEIVSLGSVLGAILLVGGLYCVLWGKKKEQEQAKETCNTTTMVDLEKANEKPMEFEIKLQNS